MNVNVAASYWTGKTGSWLDGATPRSGTILGFVALGRDFYFVIETAPSTYFQVDPEIVTVS